MNVTIGFWLWIRSFLEGRSQQVNLVGTLSSTKSCPAGVPQGSVISLSLFNVRVNDFEDSVPDHLSINTCKYADDCTQDEFFFKLARCGYTLRVTSQVSYSPEYTTPKQTKSRRGCCTRDNKSYARRSWRIAKIGHREQDEYNPPKEQRYVDLL